MPFDPSKPFTTVKQEGFDPNQPFTVPKEVPDPGSDLEAGFDSYLNSASLYTKPVIAGISGALGAGTADTGRNLGERLSDAKDAFGEARADENLKQEGYQKYHPNSYLAGGLAGAIPASSILPGLGETEGLGIGGKLLAGGKQGAKIGAITGTGQALSSANNLGEAGLDVVGGSVLGGATGAAAEGIISGVKGIGKTEKAQAIKDYLSKKYNNFLGKLSSLPVGDVRNYREGTDTVNDIIKNTGGDATIAADQVKKELKESIFEAKNKLSNQITTALEGKSETRPITPIIEALEKVKGQLDETFDVDKINQINDYIDLIKKKSPNGQAQLSDIYNMQKFLQDKSGKGFIKDGQFFAQDTKVARAAKAAYKVARGIVNGLSPDIEDANNQYSQFHDLQEVMNKNLLKEGKTPNALFTAGSGENPTYQGHLGRLQYLTGYPAIQKAGQASAVNKFANPGLVPFGTTGKTLTNLVTGAGLGGVAGGAIGAASGEGTLKGVALGAGIGGALTSPLAVKALINAENSGGQLVSNIAKSSGVRSFLDQTVPRAELMKMLEEKRKNPAITNYVQPEQAKQIFLQQESGGR